MCIGSILPVYCSIHCLSGFGAKFQEGVLKLAKALLHNSSVLIFWFLFLMHYDFKLTVFYYSYLVNTSYTPASPHKWLLCVCVCVCVCSIQRVHFRSIKHSFIYKLCIMKAFVGSMHKKGYLYYVKPQYIS